MTGRRGGLWRQRNFALFWTGESISEIGSAVTLVAIPLVAIEVLHTSIFVVTLLNAGAWFPWLVIGVPAGAWVDRLPPQPVMLTCDAVSLAAFASVPVAAWAGVLTVAQLIVVTLVAGAASVFFNSAYQVLLPEIVEEQDLTEGNAKLMGSREVAQIAGPGIGGLISDVAAPAVGLLADAISFAVSFGCLTAVRRPRERREAKEAVKGVLQGLRFVWHDPYLRVMTTFSMLANLALTGMDALIVVFLVRDVGLSGGGAGLVCATFGVGGVVGSLIARPLANWLGTARAIVIADAGGLSLALLLPLTQAGPRLAFAIAAYMCVACGVVIGNVLGVAFRQSYVPPEILGRASSATLTLAFATMPAGALIAGALATSLGIRNALWILTALVALSGLLYLLTPLRRLRELPRRPAEAAPSVLLDS